jgi:hypothetical protein
MHCKFCAKTLHLWSRKSRNRLRNGVIEFPSLEEVGMCAAILTPNLPVEFVNVGDLQNPRKSITCHHVVIIISSFALFGKLTISRYSNSFSDRPQWEVDLCREVFRRMPPLLMLGGFSRLAAVKSWRSPITIKKLEPFAIIRRFEHPNELLIYADTACCVSCVPK